MVMEKSDVIGALHEGEVLVFFEKADGTLRNMLCTLKEELLPEQVDLEETIQKKAPNPDVLAVWDTENQGWRSFRWDRLKKVNGETFGTE
jgi:hypothetical protein